MLIHREDINFDGDRTDEDEIAVCDICRTELRARSLDALKAEAERHRDIPHHVMLGDDWLMDAATNIADEAHRVVGGTLYAEDILRILKKHRG